MLQAMVICYKEQLIPQVSKSLTNWHTNNSLYLEVVQSTEFIHLLESVTQQLRTTLSNITEHLRSGRTLHLG